MFKAIKTKTQERRPCLRIASLPPSGSFFNEKMLKLLVFASVGGQGLI